MYLYCSENVDILFLAFYFFMCEDKLPLLVKILSFMLIIFRLKFFFYLPCFPVFVGWRRVVCSLILLI